MTSIDIDLRQDVPGGTAALTGRLRAVRVQVLRDGARIVYPNERTFTLPGPVSLDPTGIGDAWILILEPAGHRPVARTVRFTGASVAWAGLTDVDPTTLDPLQPGVVAAYDAVVDEIEALLASYDLTALTDAPDLTLIFENGLI